MVLVIFKKALRLRNHFYVTIREILKVLNILTLKENLLKNANSFQKTGVPFFS